MISRMEHRNQKKRRRWLALTIALVVCGIIGFTSVIVAFETPWGIRMRLLLAETIITTRHYYFAQYLTTPKEYAELIKELNPVVKSSDPNKVIIGKTPDGLTKQSQIAVKYITGSGYNGYVMLVHNPKLIRLVDAQIHNGYGEYITDMSKRVGALAGVNASGFEDPKGNGWGGIPVGLEIINGQTVDNTAGATSWTTVGFTKLGVMVMGHYSASDLTRLGVRDAMQFHPELVVDGQPQITSGDGGWGNGPRTAIGQTKNGTVIFIVINGRFQGNSGLGASQRQVMDLMLQYGAVNACAMDGGSSSVLYDNGQIRNSPSTIDPNGQRHLPDAWLVFPSVQAATAYMP